MPCSQCRGLDHRVFGHGRARYPAPVVKILPRSPRANARCVQPVGAENAVIAADLAYRASEFADLLRERLTVGHCQDSCLYVSPMWHEVIDVRLEDVQDPSRPASTDTGPLGRSARSLAVISSASSRSFSTTSSVEVISSASAASSGCRRSNSDSRTDRSSPDSRRFQGRTTPSCRQAESTDVPGAPSPHADVSHARPVTALCRASFPRVNSSPVLVSTSVYGRPCRRVRCRTGSPAESIRVCTCRRPSAAGCHSRIRRDREPRNVPSVPRRSHPHPGHSIDQSSSSRSAATIWSRSSSSATSRRVAVAYDRGA